MSEANLASLETPEKSGIESIAVLPFANRSGNPDLAYLADGLAESLINTLTNIEGLRVAPRASSFRYRDADLGVVVSRNAAPKVLPMIRNAAISGDISSAPLRNTTR